MRKEIYRGWIIEFSPDGAGRDWVYWHAGSRMGSFQNQEAYRVLRATTLEFAREAVDMREAFGGSYKELKDFADSQEK